MDLDQTLGLRILTNIGSTPVNCQIKVGWSHIGAGGRVILIAKRDVLGGTALPKKKPLG